MCVKCHVKIPVSYTHLDVYKRQVSGPGVVMHAISQVRGQNFEVLCETIKKTAFKITRVGQLVAQEASRRLGIPFGIIDLSLAPTPAVGDSVAEILEEIGLEEVGAPGTTAALAMLNDQMCIRDRYRLRPDVWTFHIFA